MKRYWIFTKKELKEQWKNYKLIVLGCVLLVFAMLSPVLAKTMPEIFKNIDMGVQFVIPDPTYVDAYGQFFKNMNQTIMIVIVFLFSGNIAQEINRGTAAMMFSKGLSRPAFVLSKFTAECLIWTFSYWLSVGVFWGYTQYLFPDQTPENFFIAMFCLWLLISFILAVINLASVISNQSYITMILSGSVIMVFYIASAFPKLTDYLPTTLGNINMELITGVKGTGDIVIPVLVTAGLTITCLLAAIALFQKKQI